MQFCPHCGIRLVIDARFCPGCGTKLADARGHASQAAASEHAGQPRGISAMGPFAAIFVALMVFGVVVAYLITRQLPAREQLLAAAPPRRPRPPATTAAIFPRTIRRSSFPRKFVGFIKETADKAHAHPDDRAGVGAAG